MTADEIEQAMNERPPEPPEKVAAHRENQFTAQIERMRPILVVPPKEAPPLSAREQAEQSRARAEREESMRKVIQTRCCEKLYRTLLSGTFAGALLYGPTGCGKSTAANWLYRNVRHDWIRAVDLATAERRHGLGSGVAPEILQARHSRALVIDDVGHEKDTAALYDALDYRYILGLPTIVTTGMTTEQLTVHISAATVRRITQQTHQKGVLVVDCHRK